MQKKHAHIRWIIDNHSIKHMRLRDWKEGEVEGRKERLRERGGG